MSAKYIPTDVARVNPQEIPVFGSGKTRMVAVGGEIRLPPKPPIRGEKIIPEANQKELKELYERGYTDLISIEEPKKRQVKKE